MSRRILLISCVVLGLWLGVTAILMLVVNGGGRQVTVSFVKAEASQGEFPTYQESERLAFAVRNAGRKPVSVAVVGLSDAQGKWVPLGLEDAQSKWVRSFHTLGYVEARQSTQLYLYLPKGSHPGSLRMCVIAQASAVQKATIALKMLIAKASGSYTGKQVWFDRLSCPVYEFIVRLENKAEPNGTANRSPSSRSVTIPAPAAAGSGR
jgi:hypothetical protein